MKTTDIFAAIEEIAPPRMAASWDRCGVQVASPAAEASRLAVALDPTPAAIGQALEWGAQIVLTHHPLGKTPRLPDRPDAHREVLKLLLGADAWLYAAHTSLDCAPGGPASWLADELGLTGRAVLDPQGTTPRIMAFYKEVATDGFDGLVLPDHLDVDRMHFDRDALRHAPQAFSCPEPQWPQLRDILTRCQDVSPMAGAMRLTEPGEAFGFGLVGSLPEPMAFEAFMQALWKAVPRSFATLIGEAPGTVRSVAYCTGSGSSLAAKAFAMGADVYVTGDVTHHPALDTMDLGLTIDVGHRALEEEMMRRTALLLAGRLAGSGIEVRFFESPDPLRAVLKS